MLDSLFRAESSCGGTAGSWIPLVPSPHAHSGDRETNSQEVYIKIELCQSIWEGILLISLRFFFFFYFFILSPGMTVFLSWVVLTGTPDFYLPRSFEPGFLCMTYIINYCQL